MEQIIKEIELLEHRIEIVNNKIKKHHKQETTQCFKRFEKQINHQT